MTQSKKDIDTAYPLDPQQEYLRGLNELHMKDTGKVNDYIQTILKILHEFELKE